MTHVELFEGSGAEWDSFARRQPGFTHFHLWRWRDVIQEVFGHECLYLSVRDGTEVQGILPLVRVRSLLFGHYLVSMPFLNYGGPLGTEPAVRALVAHATDLARTGGVRLLEMRSRIPLPIELTASHRKITVILDLQATPELTFKAFDSKLRSQVRRPQKEGVVVKFGADQVQPFFRVLATHMRDLGTPVQPLRLFEAIARAFPDDAWFMCAYLHDEPVAGGCGFQFGDEFEMTWASSLRKFNREAPNMLVYWATMERAIHQGLKHFNFGRCTPGGGTHKFKRQWGGRDEQLWWYGLSRDGETAATPSPTDGAFSWGPRVWRLLPEKIATAIGPAIVRYIP